jgi:hypothetical protein
MSQRDELDDVDSETLIRIRERTLQAERNQLHMQKPHNIIPEIKEIVEEEMPE